MAFFISFARFLPLAARLAVVAVLFFQAPCALAEVPIKNAVTKAPVAAPAPETEKAAEKTSTGLASEIMSILNGGALPKIADPTEPASTDPKPSDPAPVDPATASAPTSPLPLLPSTAPAEPAAATPQLVATGTSFPASQVEVARTYLPVYPLREGGEELPPRLLPFFASAPLGTALPGIRSLLITLHDGDREAARAFAFARSAQDETGVRHPEWGAASVFILAPQFLRGEDIAAHAGEWPDGGKALLRWAGDGWMTGLDSSSDFSAGVIGPSQNLSSFEVMDYVLLMLARPHLFPDLKQVVLAGYGGGADFVQRYAVLGTAPDALAQDGIILRFVAAHARSYLYLDAQRAVKRPKGEYVTEGAEPAFAEAMTEKCCPVNLYPFGLDALLPYGSQQGENAVRLRYSTRTVIYLAAADATQILADASPSACAYDAQGESFSERARLYYAALNRFYGEDVRERQRLLLAAKTAPEALALWRSACGQAALFGDGRCGGEP
jgi:hypothetical protein